MYIMLNKVLIWLSDSAYDMLLRLAYSKLVARYFHAR